MDFRIILDISARFEHALNNLADAMAHHPFAGYCDYDDKRAGEPRTPFAELLRGVYPPCTPAEAPEPAPEPEAPVIQPAPEPAPAAPTSPQEPEKSDGDPMAGMTVVEAMQALVSEIQQKGVDMASVNGRVRAKANELGLAYSSAACLIKAIGYVETRKVALGEK